MSAIRSLLGSATMLVCLFGATSSSHALNFNLVSQVDFSAAFTTANTLFGTYIKQGGSGTTFNLQLPPTNGSTFYGQGLFGNNVTQHFALDYDPSTGIAGLKIGSASAVNIAATTGGFQSLGISIRADTDVARTIGITNLTLNAAAIGGTVVSAPGLAYQSFALDAPLTSADFVSGFHLEGDIKMAWASGVAPNGRVSANIVAAGVLPGVNAVVDVPEPTSVLLLGAGLAGLVAVRRRRST